VLNSAIIQFIFTNHRYSENSEWVNAESELPYSEPPRNDISHYTELMGNAEGYFY
jgi:hypothetical protein